MALRNGLLVHGPTHWAAAVRTRRRRVKVASGRKPRPRRAGRRSDCPACAASSKLAEAMAVIPLVKRALPEARLPMQDARTLGAMGAAPLGAPGDPHRGARTAGTRRRPRGRRGAARAWRRRCSRCAAATSPPTTASSTRRSPPTSRTARRRRCRARSTTAAARTWSRRCSPPPPSATWRCAAPACAARRPTPPSALGSAAVAVEVFAWCERHPELGRHADAARPGYRDPARGRHARADRRSSSRSGRRRSTEILRVEGAVGGGLAHGHRGPRAARALDPDGLPAARGAASATGYYSDAYFNFTRELLLAEGRPSRAVTDAGVPEAALGARRDRRGDRGAEAARLRRTGAACWRAVHALHEGDEIAPWETVLHDRRRLLAVRAPRDRLPRHASPGARCIMRNVREVVEAAGGKPILFFPARHDHWLVQTGDGWAAHVAGAIGVSTDAQASWWGGRGVGHRSARADRGVRRRHGGGRARIRPTASPTR